MHELTLHASIVTCDKGRGGGEGPSWYSSASAKTLDKYLSKYRQSMFAGSLSQHICWSLLDAPILRYSQSNKNPCNP